MRQVILSLLLLGISWVPGFANAQDLPPRAVVGLQPGTFITIATFAPDRWRVLEHGRSQDVGQSKLEPFDTRPSVPSGPKNALRFIFEADQQGGTRLMVSNGYDLRLVYRGEIQRSSGGGFVRTSLCVVPAHLATIEMWPEPITQINLGDFQLVDEQHAPLICQ